MSSYDEEARVWCECADLADAESWEEADVKLTEYYDLRGGFISGSGDAILTAKIAVGLAKIRLDKNYTKGALQATRFANSKGGGHGIEKSTLEELFIATAMRYIKMYIPGKTKDDDDGDDDNQEEGGYEADYSKATTESLSTLGQELLDLKTIFDNNSDFDPFCVDTAHKGITKVVNELLKRNEKEKARPIVDALKDDCSGYYCIEKDDWRMKLAGGKGYW